MLLGISTWSDSELARDQTRNLPLAVCSESSEVVWHRWLEGEFFFHNDVKPLRFHNQAVFAFMEKLLAKSSVSNFPEIVWLHRSTIEGWVQLNILVRLSQNLMNSYFSFGQQKFVFKESKIPLREQLISFERVKIPFGERIGNSSGMRINPMMGQKSTALEKYAFDAAHRDSECNDIIHTDCKTFLCLTAS